jgi:transposase-like protein
MSTPYTPAAGSLDGPMCRCGTIMVRIPAAECDGVPFYGCQSCGKTLQIEVKE